VTAVAVPRAEAVVDLDAIRANVAVLRRHVGGRSLMAIVKADGYGHGLAPSARAARDGGADWLGVALLDEALELRAEGDTGPILSWLAVPGERYERAVDAGIDVSAYTVDQLEEIAQAVRGSRGRAAVQLKIDTGLSRGGVSVEEWEAVLAKARRLRDQGLLAITGIWSHLAASDDPGNQANKDQVTAFEDALAAAHAAGIEAEHVHLANSGATLALPETWHTMVRPGIAIYGLSPLAGGVSPVPLRAAMTLRAAVAMVKRLPPGSGISYGHTYVTDRPTRVALVPLGYGDGIPRHGSNAASISIAGGRCPILGRVCMDQFVVDIGDLGVRRGDEVIVFGDRSSNDGLDPDGWVPTARDWADAVGTIDYEIVTRIGPRVPRRYLPVGSRE
jgi:alanine racemase